VIQRLIANRPLLKRQAAGARRVSQASAPHPAESRRDKANYPTAPAAVSQGTGITCGTHAAHRQQRRREAEHVSGSAATIAVAPKDELVVVVSKAQEADVGGLVRRRQLLPMFVSALLGAQDSAKVPDHA